MSNSRLEQKNHRSTILSNSFHIASFLVCEGTTKDLVSVFVTLGAEDLCPSLQPWVRPVPHRTAKELHLYPASLRFITVLQ